ncbi:hypothetical protein SLE2022_317790 [Rubroshorea leprosula]
MSFPFFTMSFVSVLFFVSISPFIALASVPLSKTFKCVNEGEFDFYKAEYNANYRTVGPFSAPFMLCLYNTIPDAFTLGLLMGFTSTESLSAWVWDANLGNPVREKATLTFGQDGNLVLADSDGRIAWQTNTANKKGSGSTGAVFLLNKPKYNATLSLLRLWPDGNLRVHTFYQHVMWGAWEETFTLFPRDSMWEMNANYRRDVANLDFVRTINALQVVGLHMISRPLTKVSNSTNVAYLKAPK